MTSRMLVNGTINCTTCFSMGVYGSTVQEFGAVQRRATGRTSTTISPVSVQLVQVQVRVQGKWSLWWRAEWNDFIQASPHKRKPISEFCCCCPVPWSSPLPEFHSPLSCCSPTHKPKYLPPLPFAIGRSIYAYIYRRASGLRS